MLRLRSVWKGSGSGFVRHRKMTLLAKFWPELVSTPTRLLMPWCGHQDWRKVRQMLLVPHQSLSWRTLIDTASFLSRLWWKYPSAQNVWTDTSASLSMEREWIRFHSK